MPDFITVNTRNEIEQLLNIMNKYKYIYFFGTLSNSKSFAKKFMELNSTLKIHCYIDTVQISGNLGNYDHIININNVNYDNNNIKKDSLVVKFNKEI